MTKEEFERRVSRLNVSHDGDTIDHLWADIEAERGVVIDWSKAPAWADHVDCYFDNYEPNREDQLFLTIPRPAPKYREMSREEKGNCLYEKDIILSPVWDSLSDQIIDDLCNAAGIETKVEVK